MLGPRTTTADILVEAGLAGLPDVSTELVRDAEAGARGKAADLLEAGALRHELWARLAPGAAGRAPRAERHTLWARGVQNDLAWSQGVQDELAWSQGVQPGCSGGPGEPPEPLTYCILS